MTSVWCPACSRPAVDADGARSGLAWRFVCLADFEAVMRVLVPRGTGSIVLVGSQLARVAAPGYASYCAAKGAVESLVRALAVDYGPSGIRVNALSPGVVASPMAYVDRPDFDDQADAIAARLPLRRIGLDLLCLRQRRQHCLHLGDLGHFGRWREAFERRREDGVGVGVAAGGLVQLGEGLGGA